MGYASIGGIHYCVITTVWEDMIFYYAESEARLFSSVLPFAVSAAGCYIISYLVMAAILLTGYKDEDYQQCILAEEQEEHARGSDHLRITGFIRKWDRAYVRWNDKTPEEKTKVAFNMILFFGMLILFCFEASGWS